MVWAWDLADVPHARPGDVMVTDLRRTGDGWSGRLLNPQDGRSYRGTVTRRTSDTLVLRGCAGPFCARQVWHSVPALRRVLEGVE
jgi:uncharacterized protein (DUF2147 family)